MVKWVFTPEICDLGLFSLHHHGWLQLLSNVHFIVRVSIWEPRGWVPLENFCFNIKNKQSKQTKTKTKLSSKYKQT